MKIKPKIVVTGHDTNYIYPWMIMARSFANSTKGNFKMIAGNMNGGLREKDQLFMKDYADFLGIKLEIMDLTMPPDLVAQLGRSINGYFSLLFLDALKEDFVWLDSDLILEPGWEKIFEFEKPKNPKLSVVIRAVPDRKVTVEQLKKKGRNGAYLLNSEKYFNCGMMWLSPKMWKKLKFNLAWQDVIRQGPKLGLEFIDQDVLNYLLHDYVEILPKKFNYMPGDFDFASPVITHFAGYPKPWTMSSKAKAMFFMREAINWDRPQWRPSREGRLKSEYLDYWRHEEKMFNELKASKPKLFDEAIARKKGITKDLNFQEKLKYLFVRFSTIEFQNLILRKKPTLSGFQKDLW
jgi:lipopolysaccharide biosynthesis glycosyltransferase